MRKKTNDENSNKYPCDKYVKFVKSLCGKYSPWEIWNDFINLFKREHHEKEFSIRFGVGYHIGSLHRRRLYRLG